MLKSDRLPPQAAEDRRVVWRAAAEEVDAPYFTCL